MTFRSRGLHLLASVLLASLAAWPAHAQDDAASNEAPTPLVEWSMTYASRYSFQGFDYSESRAVLQPSFVARVGPLAGTLWANGNQAFRRWDEVDAGVQAPWAFRRLSGTAGWQYLAYPHRDWSPTQELYVEMEAAAPLSPTLTMHWDVDAGAGGYWTLGASRAFASPVGEWTLGAKLHAQQHYYAMTGLPAAETSLGLAFTAGALSFEPALTRVWAWDNGDFRGEARPQPAWMAGVAIAPK